MTPATASLDCSDPRSLRRLWQALERAEARTLRPLEWDRRFLRHWFAVRPADFHLDLDADLHDLHTRRDTQAAYLGPRGGAKSTVVTLAYALRVAVEAWEPYVLILTEAGGQAEKFVSDLRAELEGNPLLALVYPESCGPGAGEWRANAVRLRNGVLVEAIGRGGRIKGRRNRQHRPTLVVLDDVQSNKDLISAVERQHTWDWFTREVLPARAPGANVLSVGTALHREAVAVRAGTLPGWSLKTFRAVHSWPERNDLWNEWERLATNLADPDRAATAAAFEAANREEMGRGALTYWEARYPIGVLMADRARVGPSAFDTEYQQNPHAGEGAEWPASYFDGPGLWFDDFPRNLSWRVQSLDPSKGSDSKTGDFQAHVLLGLDKDGGLWADADVRKDHVPEMVERAIGLALGFGPLDALVVEDNDALGLLLPEFEERLARRALVLPLKGVRNTRNKVVRVREGLDPYLSRGRLRFRNTTGARLLVDQLRDFPGGAHDDGPDALELAVRYLEGATRSRR